MSDTVVTPDGTQPPPASEEAPASPPIDTTGVSAPAAEAVADDAAVKPEAREASIIVRGLHKSYQLFTSPGKRFLQAILPGQTFYTTADVLKDIDLTIYKGETVGIVGANGAGKSTLLSVIAGVLDYERGSVEVSGRVSALLSLGAGFVAELTGHENIFLNATMLGLSRKEVERELDNIIAFADIGDYLYQPIRTYSSGMYSRLAFAVAIHTNPDVLIIDETLSVGDEAFQRKCFARIDEMKKNGVTILFVSHSAGAVLELCDRAILLARGQRLLTHIPKTVIALYQKLIYAAPDKRNQILDEIAALDRGDLSADELGELERTKGALSKTVWKERFDPALKPESTLVYEERGARIDNVRFTDEDNRVINVLNSGGEYILQYDVTFSTAAMGARFSFLLKTVQGNEFGALWTSPRGDGMAVEPGQTVQVRFPMKLPLREGVYFANAGATAVIDGEYVTAHRIIDATAFRVLPQTAGVGDRYINLVADELPSATLKT